MNGISMETWAARAVAVALAVLLLALAAPPGWAQEFRLIAPSQPKPAKPGVLVAPPPPKPAPPPAGAANRVLLPRLKGLRFVAEVKDIVRAGVMVHGVAVEPGLALLDQPAIKRKLAAFLGKPFRLADLARIADLVRDWYRAHHLPVVHVAFPPQNISGGTVQAVVTVYRLGRVRVEGNKWFSSSVLKSEMQLAPGAPVDLATLRADIDRLNRNPFRSVDAILERSATPGDTDIALKVADRFPLRVFAGFDNDGLPATGRDLYSVGFNWGNVLGLDDQLSYQFLTTPDLWQSRHRGPGHSNATRFMGHSVNYLAPLPWGDFLNVFGSYFEMVPNLGSNFDQVGSSLQLSLRYEHDLPPIGALSQQLQFGFDYKRSNSNLAFGGTQIFTEATDIAQFPLIYDATLPDRFGRTAITNQLVLSPGGLTSGNTTAVFVASGVTGAKAAYAYDNLSVTRVTYLPWKLSSVIRLDGQAASAELLPSEQLGAGGFGSVRGYDPRVASGSEGALASFDLRSPGFSLLKGLNAPVRDSAQLLAFVDSAYVSYENPQVAVPTTAALASVGVGLRYRIDRYLDLRFDYGWQLITPPGTSHRGSLADMALTISY